MKSFGVHSSTCSVKGSLQIYPKSQSPFAFDAEFLGRLHWVLSSEPLRNRIVHAWLWLLDREILFEVETYDITSL